MKEVKKVKLCDGKCNTCPLLNHPNSKMLTHIFNRLNDKFGNGVYKIVQDKCCNMTVCYNCRIDDFCHLENCELI